MLKKYRIITTLVILCFLVNTITFDTAFSLSIGNSALQDKLASASIFDDLTGTEHKEIGNIMLALQANLSARAGNVIELKSLKEDLLLKENTIFNPANMHFFFSGDGMKSLSNGYVSVKCKVKNKEQKLKTYYAVFSTTKDGEGFPMEVYTENEWKRWEDIQKIIGSSVDLPKRDSQKSKDAKAIGRYLQHEEKIDKWIQNHMKESNNFIELNPEHFDLLWNNTQDHSFMSEELLRNLNNLNKALNGKLQQLLPKRILLIKPEEELPVIYEQGKKITVNSHSSNNSMYIFVDEKTYKNLEEGRQEGGQASFVLKKDILSQLLHEMGVMCNLPWKVTEDGRIINELDMAYQAIKDKSYEQIKDMEIIISLRNKLEPVDLNTNLLTREYAAGANTNPEETAIGKNCKVVSFVPDKSTAIIEYKSTGDADKGDAPEEIEIIAQMWEATVNNLVKEGAKKAADGSSLLVVEPGTKLYTEFVQRIAQKIYHFSSEQFSPEPEEEAGRIMLEAAREILAEIDNVVTANFSKKANGTGHWQKKAELPAGLLKVIPREGITLIEYSRSEFENIDDPKKISGTKTVKREALYTVRLERGGFLTLERKTLKFDDKETDISDQFKWDLTYGTIYLDLDNVLTSRDRAAKKLKFIYEGEMRNVNPQKFQISRLGLDEEREGLAFKILDLVECSFLNLYSFSKDQVAGDILAFAKETNRFSDWAGHIVLHEYLLYDPMAYFYEICAYFATPRQNNHMMQLKLVEEGKAQYLAVDIRYNANYPFEPDKAPRIKLSEATQAFVKSEGWPKKWKENNHYLIRVLMRELFGKEDKAFTDKIRSILRKEPYRKSTISDDTKKNQKRAVAKILKTFKGYRPLVPEDPNGQRAGTLQYEISGSDLPVSFFTYKGEKILCRVSHLKLHRQVAFTNGDKKSNFIYITAVDERGNPRDDILRIEAVLTDDGVPVVNAPHNGIRSYFMRDGKNILFNELLWTILPQIADNMQKNVKRGIKRKPSKPGTIAAQKGDSPAELARKLKEAVRVESIGTINHFVSKNFGIMLGHTLKLTFDNGKTVKGIYYNIDQYGNICLEPTTKDNYEREIFTYKLTRLKKIENLSVKKKGKSRSSRARPTKKKAPKKVRKTLINEMTALAQELGVEVARPILEKNYTLITCDDFYKNENEYKNDILEYGSIFNLERIKPAKPKTTVARILEKIKSAELDPSSVIVQLPKVFSEKQYQSELDRLANSAPGVRFMIIDTQGLKNDHNSANYRKNIYVMMLLARKIDKDTPADSKLYRLLKFFMNSCLGEGKEDLITGYMKALVSNDITLIVKTVLSYKPMEKYDVPDYDKVAATLIAA